MTEKNITKMSTADLFEAEDKTRDDAPDGLALGPAFWKKARIVFPEGPKKQITMRLDADMLAWFKAQGKGYQTRINAILRSFYEARREPRK